MSKKNKVFISYAREDIETARKLYHDLKKAGVNPWLDKEELIPGQNWKLTVTREIKECRYFIALMSSHSVTKQGFVQTELKKAMDILEQFPDEDIFIIPIRIDECNIPPKLADIHYEDIFHSYEECLKKILRAFPEGHSKPDKSEVKAAENKSESGTEGVYKLRSEPKTLSKEDVKAMLKKHGFYDKDWNKSGDFRNDLTDNGDGTVTDEKTGLMWQKLGSDKYMTFKEAGDYIDGLNSRKSGYTDWRIPTLEELASLLENKKANERYIDPVFDCKGYWYWSSDKMASGGAWYVYFYFGDVYWDGVSGSHVRAVRLQTS
ncbi:MAG: TIR domain-containing protein [Desulfobacterales bacterium]|nr:TIR domain-containing protein [Desulfobacterales bacterium]